ncbi:Light-sensor Protein kinase, partial [Peltigera leucophlebia]|nr:Light-sensor Protein kinase [Peltigera leucophlebia]
MPEESKTLGLGLAQVGRLVRNMNGQLRLNSEDGKGSRFVITLGFGLPDINTHEPSYRGSFVEKQPLAPPIGKEEHFLVHILAEEMGKEDSHSKSVESVDSTNDSFRSLKTAELRRDSECNPITSRDFAMPGESYPPNKPAFRPGPSNAENLQILVAEDDINRKIVQKQLEKPGHS